MDQFVGAGTVEWIGTRPEKRAEVVCVTSVLLDPAYGIQGDHYAGRSGKRQVILIQAEQLPAIASMLHCDQVKPERINLLALKNKSFQLGEAVLECIGLCHPCSRLEENLGLGGDNAMRGHGGITARVISPGKVQIGAACEVV